MTIIIVKARIYHGGKFRTHGLVDFFTCKSHVHSTDPRVLLTYTGGRPPSSPRLFDLSNILTDDEFGNCQRKGRVNCF